MADLTITRNGELMVAQIEGATDDGTEFVDAYIGDPMTVVDSGRILLPIGSLPAFEFAARERGLSLTSEEV
jgi:hypothetical protein